MARGVQLTYAGSANDLHAALRAMGQNFLLALVILFALMAALFRSVRDSLLVMVVIPVSVAGGILALRLGGLAGFQALDLLTMIGFIILLGLVVNAAILVLTGTRAPAQDRPPSPVQVAVAQLRELAPVVRAAGMVRSRASADLAAAVSGRLQWVAEAGTSVAAGEVIARLVNPDELEIRLFVPLRYVRAIRPGNEVRVTTEQRSFTAAVSSIVPAGDPRSQSFEVLVKAPKVDGLLAAGNTVEVELPLGEPQRSLAVPRDALIIRAEGLHVYRVDDGQRAERVGVEAGVADGDWIEVKGEGLDAGDQVVVRGGETLRGGEKLQIVGIYEEAPPLPVATGR